MSCPSCGLDLCPLLRSCDRGRGCGALFAAFLVTLLIYRMKKKDEGSYTLEEPKQAKATYQKPDKQEEFYA